MTIALELKNLKKTYESGVVALRGIDLVVEQGDFYALLGPNGAGKSTTIGIVTSLVNKTAGTVKVFGYDLDTDHFGVHAKIVGVDVGPSITRFELQPDPGVKVNKIVNLADDLALNLATSDIRIEAPIPGKAAVGIEVPNEESVIVGLREIDHCVWYCGLYDAYFVRPGNARYGQ